MDCSTNSELTTDLDVNNNQWLSGIQPLSRLVGLLVSVSLCVNIFVIWATSNRRFSHHFNTPRLVLRCSGAIHLSLCAVIAEIILRPIVLDHTGSDNNETLQCTRYNSAIFAGVIIAASCIIVAGRQGIMYLTFDHGVAQAPNDHFHAGELLRPVAAVTVVGFVGATLLWSVSPAIDQPLCFVVGVTSTRGVYLLLVPAVINVTLGAMVVVRGARHSISSGRLRRQMNALPLQLTSVETPSRQDGCASLDVIYSRRKRLLIATNVAILTWIYLGTTMVTGGVLTQTVSVDTLLVVSGYLALDSVCSAFVAADYWS